jgi:hypothetical protein
MYEMHCLLGFQHFRFRHSFENNLISMCIYLFIYYINKKNNSGNHFNKLSVGDKNLII